MIPMTFRRMLTVTVVGVFVLSPGLAAAQGQPGSQAPGQQQPAGQTTSRPQQTTTQDPSQGQPQWPNRTPPPPPPQAPAPQKTSQPPQKTAADQPIQQKDTVTPKNSKEDVEAIGNRGVGKGVNFYSLEREIALGKGLAQEVERSSKLIDDPVVTEYVNRVGQNLVRNSDARVPFTIKVIDSDEVNAFALPGGFFYVNSGLILRAQEESELAGVMAHEISHVTARHGTKNATKGELMQLATIPLMLLGPAGWAGYDPNSFVTFFERIQADEKRRPGTIPKVFSTHPPTPDRIETAQKEIARILPNKPEYIVTTSEFDSVKARLRNIMFARKVQDNAPGKPSLRTRTEQTDKQKTQGKDPNSTDDDRPTLKRRPDSPYTAPTD